MYEEFFDLREKPFSLNPDPSFLYLSRRHRSALHMLEYGLTGQAGVVVLTGQIGSGKTTLVRHFLSQIGKDVTVGLMTNTYPALGDLLKWIALAFKLDFKDKEAVELYQLFIDFVESEHCAGRRTVLIVDEAQNLRMDALEELRMLSNVNVDKDMILQTILVGQPQLLDMLQRPELSQFAQRVSVDYHLGPLDLPETFAYIRHRLRVAGGDPGLFDSESIGCVYYVSGGIPRLINILCDTALVYAFADDRRHIDLDTVLAVVEDRKSGVLHLFGERGRDIERESVAGAVKKYLDELADGQ